MNVCEFEDSALNYCTVFVSQKFPTLSLQYAFRAGKLLLLACGRWQRITLNRQHIGLQGTIGITSSLSVGVRVRVSVSRKAKRRKFLLLFPPLFWLYKYN